MNRYRNGAGLGGSSKATPSTICQKCLKKDDYECKASTQERPYVSRPSRTQQLLDPKLVPQLTSDVPNHLLQKKGIADKQLARKEAERGRGMQAEPDTGDNRTTSRKRSRSLSSSSDSVSTISTNRSPSHSPKRAKYDADDEYFTSQRDPTTLPRHRPLEKKRRRSPSSSPSYVSESSHEGRSRSRSRSRSQDGGRNTRRRRGAMSPDERGRRRSSKDWRGSARVGGRSRSMDRSQIARQRLSMTPGQFDHDRHRDRDRGLYRENYPPRSENRGRYENGAKSYGTGRHEATEPKPPPRKARSLSPFSKRLALTQAMNMGR